MESSAIWGTLAKRGFKAFGFVKFNYQVFFRDEADANQLYRAIIPQIRRTILLQGREHDEVESLLALLVKAAPFGAKRRNFTRKYVKPQDGWKLLPDDPSEIPFGHWY